MLETSKITERTPVSQLVEVFRDGPPGPWPNHWGHWKNVREAHVQLVNEEMTRVPDYPEGLWSGRGIVISVSAKPGMSSGKYLHHGYLPGAWVVAREIRRHGCTLPIMFAHLGPLEWDHTLTRLVERLGVTVMDLEAESDKAHPVWKRMRILAGWESKIEAVCRSPFEEVLYLDADSIPLRSPEFLFASKQFQHYGAVFWPDVPPQDGREEWLPEAVWLNLGMEYQSEARAGESGQYLIHKKKWWRELCLARWMNEHSDYLFLTCFGDKDLPILAAYKWYFASPPGEASLNYFMPQRGPGGNHSSLVQHWADGPFTQHLTRNKPNLDGFPHPGAVLVRPEAEKHLAELRGIWCGRLWRNQNPTDEEAVIAAGMREGIWSYKRVGIDSRPMRFLEDYRIGRGLAACETDWDVFVDGDGPLLVITDMIGKPTCLLRERGEIWAGKWLQHERCEVVIERAS